MDKIQSFTVDHDFIKPGMYISRIDDDIVTYDLRTRTPNAGDYMDNVTMHTVEHMLATFSRNSDLSDKIIYFGPMGCRTGFYLLIRNLNHEENYAMVKEILDKTINYEGPVFGASRKECGNYLELNLESAKRECKTFLNNLLKRESEGKANFVYDNE